MPPAGGAAGERGAPEPGAAGSADDGLKSVPFAEEDVVHAVLEGTRVYFPGGEAEVGDEECVVFLDTETTGLDQKTCKVLELALLRAWYSPSQRRLVFIDGAYDELEDPQEQIPRKITELTGISNQRFSGPNAGLKFDREAAQGFVSEHSCGGRRPLLIAHNATFDRKFCDKYFPEWSCDADWVCSLNGIRWPPGSRKQGDLLKARGYCFVGHRAINDVLALAWLMHLEPESFMAMLESGRLERGSGASRAAREPARASSGSAPAPPPVPASVPAPASAAASAAAPAQRSDDSPPENRHGVVDFGKHRGKTFDQVVEEDPGYVSWVLRSPASSRGMQEFQVFLRGIDATLPAEGSAPESRHGVVSYGKKHKGKTYDQVVEEDPGYVSWVLRNPASSRGMQEFQDFLRASGLVATSPAGALA